MPASESGCQVVIGSITACLLGISSDPLLVAMKASFLAARPPGPSQTRFRQSDQRDADTVRATVHCGVRQACESLVLTCAWLEKGLEWETRQILPIFSAPKVPVVQWFAEKPCFFGC